MISDEAIINMILSHEGSEFTNDSNDRGGPTKFGITLDDLRIWRHDFSLTANDVRNLTRDEVGEIYRTQNIRPFDHLSDQIRLNCIDFGVNAGVRRAIMMLQQLILARVDGGIGPETKALANSRNWNELYVGSRLLYYEQIIYSDSTQMQWRKGWHNRALAFLTEEVSTIRRVPITPRFGFTGKAYQRKVA